MKPKIKFGAFDGVLILLLVAAIAVNVWAYTRSEPVAEQPTYGKESSAGTTVPTRTTAPAKTTLPIRQTTKTMPYLVDGDEGVYTGEIAAGKPEGSGEFQTSDTAWSYDGDWHNGLMHGEGTLTYPDSVFKGTFSAGIMNGEFLVYSEKALRYRGTIVAGKLNGQGALYTTTGTLIYEGSFSNDMLDESAANRTARGEAFAVDCQDMSPTLYDSVMAAGNNPPGTRVHVWGSPLGLSEQTASGTIIIAHKDDTDYPIALSYRYGVNESKVTGASAIEAWGVVTGIFVYDEQDGFESICPLIEVVYLQRAE